MDTRWIPFVACVLTLIGSFVLLLTLMYLYAVPHAVTAHHINTVCTIIGFLPTHVLNNFTNSNNITMDARWSRSDCLSTADSSQMVLNSTQVINRTEVRDMIISVHGMCCIDLLVSYVTSTGVEQVSSTVYQDDWTLYTTQQVSKLSII